MARLWHFSHAHNATRQMFGKNRQMHSRRIKLFYSVFTKNPVLYSCITPRKILKNRTKISANISEKMLILCVEKIDCLSVEYSLLIAMWTKSLRHLCQYHTTSDGVIVTGVICTLWRVWHGTHAPQVCMAIMLGLELGLALLAVVVPSDVKFHEIFCPEIFHEIFHEIFLKY